MVNYCEHVSTPALAWGYTFGTHVQASEPSHASVCASGTCVTKSGQIGQIGGECETELRKFLLRMCHAARNAGKWPENRTKCAKGCGEMEQEFERNATAKCAKECGGNARNLNGMRTECELNALKNAGNGRTFERKTANELRHGMRGN